MANSAAILIASKLVSGFIFRGTLTDLILAGLVLALINALIKPVIELIALPAVFLTLGLFNIIINMGLLLLADRFLSKLTITSLWAAFLGVLIIGTVNLLITRLNNHTGNTNNF